MATFTDLPAEIRNIIYAELLTGSGKGFSLLNTSKLIHEEALSHFYQHNNFEVDLLSPQSHGITILPPIPDKYLRYLRHITINANINANTSRILEAARTITALGTIGAHVEDLTIVLSSNTSKVLRRRIDDATLDAGHPITVALQHVLSSGVAKVVRVELRNVWFALGIVNELQRSSDRLEVVTSSPDLERPLAGHTTTTHLHALGFDSQDIEDVEHLRPPCPDFRFSPSTPSSLSTALSELDMLSFTEFETGIGEDVGDIRPTTNAKSDETFSDKIDIEEWSGNVEEGYEYDENGVGYVENIQASVSGEEDLGEDDDVEDEEMEDIDDFDAVMENMEEMEMHRINEEDLIYMVNFAPSLLGQW